MFWPARVTASDSGLSLRPLHVVHARGCMYSSSSRRTASDSVSSYGGWSLERIPSQLVPELSTRCPLLPPVPYRSLSRTSALSSPQGALRLNPNCLASPGRITFLRYPSGSPHGNTTPSRMLMLGSPRSSSSLTSRREPRPPQAGHAPNGELNEKWRGSSSGSEMPHTGQPYLSEKRCGLRSSWR